MGDRVLSKEGIADRMEQMGNKMIQIAKGIMTSGNKRMLRKEEKELVRMAHLPIIKDTTKDMVAQFAAGDIKAYENASEAAYQMFRDLENL